MTRSAVCLTLLCLLLPACASGPDRFAIQAIDSFGRTVPCLLLLNDEEPPVRDFAVFINGPSLVPLAFKGPEDVFRLRMLPTRLDEEGTPLLPSADQPSDFLPAERVIDASDGRNQLFILRRRDSR